LNPNYKEKYSLYFKGSTTGQNTKARALACTLQKNVDLHMAGFGVDSEPGEGSTFNFTLNI